MTNVNNNIKTCQYKVRHYISVDLIEQWLNIHISSGGFIFGHLLIIKFLIESTT